MNTPVSSVVTGGVTLTTATLVPLVQWALNGFVKPVPADVPFLIAACIITGSHAAYNIYVARSAAKVSPAAPAAPVAPSIIQS